MTNAELELIRRQADDMLANNVQKSIETIKNGLHRIGCSEADPEEGELFNQEQKEILAVMATGSREGWPKWLWDRAFEDYISLLRIATTAANVKENFVAIIAVPGASLVSVKLPFAEVTGYVDRATGVYRARIKTITMIDCQANLEERWPEIEQALIAEARKSEK